MNYDTNLLKMLASEADSVSGALSRTLQPTAETINEAAFLLSQCAELIRTLIPHETRSTTLRGIPPTPAEAEYRKALAMNAMPDLELF